MHHIIFEGVRCFHQIQNREIKPITLLVGENSSGKSTFLALTRIAWDIVEGDLREDVFNEEPFMLGSYDQIASYRGGQAGRVKHFTIGLDIPIESKFTASDLFGDSVEIIAKFSSHGSESKLDQWSLQCGNFILATSSSSEKDKQRAFISTPEGVYIFPERYRLGIRGWGGINRFLSDSRILLSTEFRDLFIDDKEKAEQKKNILSEKEVGYLQVISIQISEVLGKRPYAFAPIRTRPKRTYDPMKEVPEPEGSHVPMVLAKTLSEQSQQGIELRRALNSFGQASGLFNAVEVKRKGQKDSDPFQIGIKTIGQSFNLLDVGYGVSQVLPIIVDSVQNPRGTTFLLQQPEVHLHPRAQAELGSFLVALAHSEDKRFVIETHSDYLIDRIRMDVRDKKDIKPDDVAILYFEKSKSGVDIYDLSLDEYGNILNAPPSFRQFFLEEEKRILGI